MFKVKELKKNIAQAFYDTGLNEGLIFCFGKSIISRLIQAKTRLDLTELVPSHVAMYKGDYIYESTTDRVKIGHKTIPAGVRRWQLDDYVKSEKRKDTDYNIVPVHLDLDSLEGYVHYPYGIDSILDYILKDGSDGESDGLICSQYANLCCKAIDAPCVTPAELARHYHKTERVEVKD